jgi:lauroyl/myristoyl acyltransferase
MQRTLDGQGQMSHAGHRRLQRTVRRMFLYSSRNYLSAFALSSLAPDGLFSRTHVHSQKHLEAALALGKGVILISVHPGPFNNLSTWLVERLPDERILTLRYSPGIKCLPLRGSPPLRAMVSVL